MYTFYLVDDVIMFSHNGANGKESKTRMFRPVRQLVALVGRHNVVWSSLPGWRYLGRSMLSPTASCVTCGLYVARSCVMTVQLCISSFVDDAIFPHIGSNGA